MRTENEIIHRIKRLKYLAYRQSAGFDRVRKVGHSATGNPLNFLTHMSEAHTLQWVLGREVPVKDINWYQAGLRAWRRSQK